MPESSCDVLGVDDIEDLIGLEDVSPRDRYINKHDVVPKVRKRKTKKSEFESSPSDTIEGNIKFIYLSCTVRTNKTFFFKLLLYINETILEGFRKTWN